MKVLESSFVIVKLQVIFVLRKPSFEALFRRDKLFVVNAQSSNPGSEPTFQLCECVDLDVALLLGLAEPRPEPARRDQRRAVRPPLPPQLRCPVTRDT